MLRTGEICRLFMSLAVTFDFKQNISSDIASQLQTKNIYNFKSRSFIKCKDKKRKS